ncbi:hypothetical protein RIR_jg4587.t1 [Rhizophagus irregularis DAOM 181602=DAOM 197198]|nr:hypothetical protein RIR_jg4587.t1 [Rhizophagus irregularis DAOM 181602=DAOM 197198]
MSGKCPRNFDHPEFDIFDLFITCSFLKPKLSSNVKLYCIGYFISNVSSSLYSNETTLLCLSKIIQQG